MNKLTIALIQADLIWGDTSANYLKFERLFERIEKPIDLVILPEMFTTGFNMSPALLAEPFPGPGSRWMQKQAKKLNAAIVGSLIIEAKGQFFNRLLWVMPDGEIFQYDKRHLFSLAGEHLQYTAGKNQLIVHYKGWKIMPLVCYDLRFPVWSRNTTAYDLLIYVANFPDRRGFAWRSLLKARAIENQSYTVGLNRVGVDGNNIYYAGDSCVLNYAGRYLAQLPPRENVHRLELKASSQQLFREKFAFLNDRDSFQINHEHKPLI